MSIKTPKRLVLGLIASLVFAPFAAIAPASATASTLLPFQVTAASYKSANFAATVAVQQVAGANNFVEFSSGSDTSADVLAVVKVTGGTIISKTDTVSASTLNAAATELVYSTNDVFDSPDANKFRVGTPTAGTITVVIATRVTAATGVVTDTVRQTFTITVTETATAGVVSVANSTSFLDTKAATAHDATSDATVSVIKTNGTFAGSVKLTLQDGNKTALNAATVTAVVTGPGVVGISADAGASASATKGRAVSAVTTSDGVLFASIYADGTAGVSTITFSVGTTVVATETVTFFGDVATLTATPVHAYIPDTADGVANTDTDAIVSVLVAKDANGVVVPAIAADYTASSATELTAQSVTAAATVLAAAGTVNGVALKATDLVLVVDPTATKTGAKTLTVTHTSTKVATTVSFNVSLVKANAITLTADKTSYLPGELVTVTLTARDKEGAFIANGPGTGLLTGSLTSSQSITSSLFTADVVTKSGIATATFYAPLIEGTVILTGTVGAAGTYVETALAATKLTLNVVVAKPVVPVVVPPIVYDKPTLSFVKDGGRIILSGTAENGEGDIIIYTKRVGTTAWKERAKTLEVAAPGDFNGSIKAPKNNVVIRVKQEGTGLFSNQIIVLK